MYISIIITIIIVLIIIVIIILNIILLIIIIVILLIIYMYICNLLKPRYMKHILNMVTNVSAPSPDPSLTILWTSSPGAASTSAAGWRDPCRWWVRPGKSPGCRPVKRWPPTADASDPPTKWCIAGPPSPQCLKRFRETRGEKFFGKALETC